MQYVTISYTDGAFDEVGGSSLQLHLLELVQRIDAGQAPVGEHRTSCGTRLRRTGDRRDHGSDGELVVSAALEGESKSRVHTVRLPREAVDRRIQMNSGDPLMLVADYRRRHTLPVAAQRGPHAEPSGTRQAQRPTTDGLTGGARN
ncbi:MAG: hypothetical protein M3P51_08200 [Chloroflexota bacterium]|nr:hypothetical protein [Chloroflexota bacterium]